MSSGQYVNLVEIIQWASFTREKDRFNSSLLVLLIVINVVTSNICSGSKSKSSGVQTYRSNQEPRAVRSKIKCHGTLSFFQI